MKLEKAIEILNELVDDAYIALDADGPIAIRLGIEALKRIQWERKYHWLDPANILPGETKE